ncbi:hypothetical protein GCM10008927_17570 [Amylibacter ulvae]|uniref:Esterase/lipase superfamily enzyme n=1 Tax=Paramylibacter ulvae TaxID=1651968 RepID=A0ABQ3D195_9RHOB|nr:alpha/beta fold hydrolase [Amylibacter ulvae]GHA52545.1 hypothetical protein GCM10008927_17570 [Amylibacter ulvae]
MKRLLISLVLIVAACAPRGEITLITQTIQNGFLQQIYVATSREPINEPRRFSQVRSETIHFSRYDVSVPPLHKPGQVEWPKSTPNPQTDFITTSISNFDNSARMIADTKKQTVKNPDEAFVFIHGYNNNFAEGIYRFAQMSKDLELDGTKYHYSWPSAGDARGYIYDRDSVLFARDGLETFLNDIAKTGAKDIFIVAHSIGSALTVETLRQMSIGGDATLKNKIRGVVLISPDIDVDVFATQLTRINPLPQPFLIFASRKDLALRISSLLTGTRNRVGLLDNEKKLARFNIDMIDVTNIKDGGDMLNHSIAATSPTLLKLLGNTQRMREVFDPTREARKGANVVSLIIQTANDATQIIVNPLNAN